MQPIMSEHNLKFPYDASDITVVTRMPFFPGQSHYASSDRSVHLATVKAIHLESLFRLL